MPAKIYLTVYTVRRDFEADPMGTLEKIKAMGYEGVEIDLNFTEELFNAVKAKLKELELPAIGAHVGMDDMMDRTDFFLGRMKQLGMKYLGIPWLQTDCVPGGDRYAETKAKIRYMAERCRIEGITYHYHNHDFEFVKIGGVCKQDILLQDVPEVLTQLDVGWCAFAGQDPAAYIRHYGHRMPVLHLKDFTVNAGIDPNLSREERGFRFQPVGMGQVDFPAVFQAADEVGVVWMGVEQDESVERPALDAARLSLEYIRKTYK